MSLVEGLLHSAPQKFRLWPSIGKLLRLRVRIWWNGIRRAKLRAKIGMGALVVFAVGLMALLFFLSTLLLRFLRSPQLAEYVNPEQFLSAIPTMVLSAAFFITIVTNFGVMLQALYLSRDMDFLVVSPIPMRAVFVAKLLEAILPNFALFCAFSLPVLFGLGASGGYTALYYPLLVIMLALLALAAGGLASILVMAVVRVIPARRVAEVLGFLGALVSILCGQSGNILGAIGFNRSDVGSALDTFSRLNTPWSPLAWAGRGLLAIGRADWLPGLGLSMLSLALAGGLFAGTLLLAENLYYSGWASMQGVARRKRPRLRQVPGQAPALPAQPARMAAQNVWTAETAGAGMPSSAVRLPATVTGTGESAKKRRGFIPAPLRGLVIKDLLLLRRDPRNLSQLITPLILGFVFLFTGGRGGRAGGGSVENLRQLGVPNLDMYALIGLALFVGWMLMNILSSLSFTREGRNYWLLKASPIHPGWLMAGKFLVAYLPGAVFSLAYLVLAFIIRRVSFLYFPFAALTVALIIAGGTGVSLAFGTVGANLDWDSPHRQRLRGSTGCVSMIAISAYLVISLAVFLLPTVLMQIFTGQAPLWSYLLGLVFGGIVAGLGAILPPWMMLPRLAHLGEPE